MYKVEVDAQQNKVTVTGNVDSDVLIKRLLKSGKHAQLSPEKKNAKKDGNINKHEQQPKTTKPSAKKAADAKPNLDGESIADSTQKDKAVGKPVPAKNGDGHKSDPDAGGDTPKPDSFDGKDAGDGDGGVEGGESGKKKKKKKRKGQKGQSSESGEASDGGKVDGDGACDVPCPGGYPVHPPAGLQTPIYAVSYHTAHPTWSYAVNYAPPPPPPSYPGWETHRMFSDENPNSCFLM